MIDVVILCGGLGTRLAKAVPSLPKALAPIQKTPFLQLLFNQFKTFPMISKVILALGHRAPQVEDFVKDSLNSQIPIEFSIESTPLGTGGAILLALEKTQTELLLVLNGDTFFDLSFQDFYQFHLRSKSALTIACRNVLDNSRFGTIEFDKSYKIHRFTEKAPQENESWVSGGIYLMEKKLFASLSLKPYSLEQDLFPLFLKKGAFAYPCSKTFIDIGTLDSYEIAQEMLQPWI